MPDVLLEKSELQLGFTMIANWLISAWVPRIIHFMKDRHRPVVDADDFAAGSFAETFAHRKHLKQLPEQLQNFIKHAITTNLRLVAREQITGTRGDYLPTQIRLFFDQKDFTANLDQIRAGNATIIRNILATRHTTLVHELRHAYDDFASGGKYRESPEADKAQSSKATARVNPSDENVWNAHQDYLSQPHEISARFSTVVTKIYPFLQGRWADYLYQFKEQFDGWYQMEPKVRLRLIKRLAAEWTDVHGRAPTDINPFIRKLDGKLRAARINVSVTPAHGNIEIRDLDRVPPRAQATALHQVTYLADIFKRQVVTYDNVPMLQGFGFVRNQGRNKGYRISAPLYRPPREHMKSQR